MKTYNVESIYPLHIQISHVVPHNPCKQEKQKMINHYHTTHKHESIKTLKLGVKLRIRVLKLLGHFTFRNNYRSSTHQKFTSSLRLGKVKRESEQYQENNDYIVWWWSSEREKMSKRLCCYVSAIRCKKREKIVVVFPSFGFRVSIFDLILPSYVTSNLVISLEFY
jgi:hypothetical protein